MAKIILTEITTSEKMVFKNEKELHAKLADYVKDGKRFVVSLKRSKGRIRFNK